MQKQESGSQTRRRGERLAAQIQADLWRLESMSVNELQAEHYRVNGEATRARNKRWLIKQIFFQAQESAERLTLSPEAWERIEELAEGVSVRARPKRPLTPPKLTLLTPELAPDEETPTSGGETPTSGAEEQPKPPRRDARLPAANSVLTRVYKREVHEVLVLEDRFVYRENDYKSLSAVAKHITGSNQNGFSFFKLTRKHEKEREERKARRAQEARRAKELRS